MSSFRVKNKPSFLCENGAVLYIKFSKRTLLQIKKWFTNFRLIFMRS